MSSRSSASSATLGRGLLRRRLELLRPRQRTARDELLGEPERAHVLDPLRIEDSIQMIALVLHDACMEAIDRAVDRPAELVAAAITDPRGPRHEPAHPGHAEAPFPTRFALVTERRDLGIHEHGERH